MSLGHAKHCRFLWGMLLIGPFTVCSVAHAVEPLPAQLQIETHTPPRTYPQDLPDQSLDHSTAEPVTGVLQDTPEFLPRFLCVCPPYTPKSLPCPFPKPLCGPMSSNRQSVPWRLYQPFPIRGPFGGAYHR